MRTLLLFLTIACFLLPATFAAGQTIQKDNYFASTTNGQPCEPQFIDGMYMDGHHRKVIFRNVVSIKKAKEKIVVTPVAGYVKNIPTIDSIEDQEPVAVNNNDSSGKDPVQETAQKTNAIGNIDIDTNATISVAVKTATPVQKTTSAVTDNGNIQSSDVVVMDMPQEPIDPVISKYADMIEEDPSDINNYPLYRFIDKWYGTEYRWGGTTHKGIDCSGFSQKLYDAVYGVALLRTVRLQHRKSEHIRHAGDAAEGDLVFFRIHRFRISHVGVYLANGYFVHASRSRGVAISNLDNRYWRRRYAGCGHIERKEGPEESDNLQ